MQYFGNSPLLILPVHIIAAYCLYPRCAHMKGTDGHPGALAALWPTGTNTGHLNRNLDIMAKIAFLGLGVMGYPMAGHIAAAGHEVTVYNRTAAKAEAWVAQHGGGNGGTHAPTPAAAAAGADIVLSCVGDDPDVLEVALGADGAIPAMHAGAIYIDNSTVSAEVARRLAAAGAQRGVGVLDAPVSGGQAGAENGKLTVMVGGTEDHFAAALPVMECYGARVVRMGEAGSGQLAKMVNQICIAGLVQGLSEGLNFAIESGLDTDALLEAISGGAAQSWQMVNRGHTMVRNEFDFGFAVDWMRKDLRICREEAARNGAPLPVTEIVAGFYDELSEMGHGRGDTSSLIRRLRKG
jgi:3-hydroxyisobutyrate dehydrogenase